MTTAARVGYSLAFARDMIPEKMKAYSASLPPIYARFKGRYLAIGGPGRGVDHLAGDWGPRAIMLGIYPSLEAVRGFWWSPEYRAAAELRRGAVNVDVAALEGDAPPDGHDALLVAAIRSGAGSSPLENFGRSMAAHPDARVLVVAQGPSVEVLEGALAGHDVAVVSYPDDARLRAGWTAIEAQFSRSGASVQAYAVRRARP